MEEMVVELLGIIGTALSAILLGIFKKFSLDIQKELERMVTNIEATNKSNFVMLQNTILQQCKHHQAIGYIESHDAEMLLSLANQYYAMNGNGYVKKQVEATFELPQEPMKEE